MTLSPFLATLASSSPAPDRAEAMDLYGWLVGSWEIDTVQHRHDGSSRRLTGEIHAGWVLEGRAIQDLWIWPRRPAPSAMHGTTLRISDPGIDAWHIIWADPLSQHYARQVGQAEGADIVQVGKDSRGMRARWRFTEITPNGFHWIGEERPSDGDAWWTAYEHFARRTAS